MNFKGLGLLCFFVTTLSIMTSSQAESVPFGPAKPTTNTHPKINLAVPFDEWLEVQAGVSLSRMNQNISPLGSARGVIIASPSRQNPDYYFHWIRDSALVIDSLLVPAGKDLMMPKPWMRQTFMDFLTFSRRLQQTSTLTGLGEPRFNTDGSPWMYPWARPQNDGPALRLITLFHGIDRLNLQKVPAVQNLSRSIVQSDLRYLIDNLHQPSFDIWEEVRGDHFYTRACQLGAFAQALAHFDSTWNISSSDLKNTIDTLRADLNKHWRPDQGYFSVTLNRIEGAENYKFSDLDIAIVLAALHADPQNPDFSIRDERILSTAYHLEMMFAQTYVINGASYPIPLAVAPAMGRYVDDVYFGGNPWYITTAAFAELHYKLAQSLSDNPDYQINPVNISFLRNAFLSRGSVGDTAKIQVGVNFKNDPELRNYMIEALKTKGDLFMTRIRIHTPDDGAMAEQFGRNQGEPVSAADLTWSYASFLTAYKARQNLSR